MADDNNQVPPVKAEARQASPSSPVPPSIFASVGGRKFALAGLAMIVLLLGTWLGMDEQTKWWVVTLALGGAGLIAAEDVLNPKKKNGNGNG